MTNLFNPQQNQTARPNPQPVGEGYYDKYSEGHDRVTLTINGYEDAKDWNGNPQYQIEVVFPWTSPNLKGKEYLWVYANSAPPDITSQDENGLFASKQYDFILKRIVDRDTGEVVIKKKREGGFHDGTKPYHYNYTVANWYAEAVSEQGGYENKDVYRDDTYTKETAPYSSQQEKREIMQAREVTETLLNTMTDGTFSDSNNAKETPAEEEIPDVSASPFLRMDDRDVRITWLALSHDASQMLSALLGSRTDQSEDTETAIESIKGLIPSLADAHAELTYSLYTQAIQETSEGDSK